MSTLKTDNIVNVAGNGPPTLTNGVNVTGSVAATTVTASGVITGSSFAGSGANLTGISSEPFKPVSLAGATYVVTVASVDSVNKFHIAGVSNPTLNFSKANVYIFDLSDSSNAGHPLVFKTSGSVAYTTGVVVTGTAGQAGAKVTITVAASAPLALLYSCSAHGNAMGNTIAVAASGALDVGTFNFFDNGPLAANTTVSFSSVPTNAKWSYSYKNNFIGNPFEPSAAVYTSKSFSVASQVDDATDVFFKPDGTRMYVVSDRNNNDQVYSYDLSTAWDVTSAVYQTVVSISEGRPSGIFWKPDGTRFYLTGYTGDDVDEYNVSTAWSLASISFVRSFSVASQDTSPHGAFFKPDGTKMYLVGDSNDKVYEYNLSSAWNISSASYSQSLSVTSQDTSPVGIYLTSDGLKLFLVGAANDSVYQYTLSTAWDITTASFVNSFSTASQDTSPRTVFFKPDGTQMYIMGNANKTVFQYALGTIPAVTLPSSVVETPTVPLQDKRVTYDFFTLDGGTTVNLIGEEIV